jgi:hypothetical protein
MTTIELKNLLIHRISEINNVSFPEAIKVILESKSEANIFFFRRSNGMKYLDPEKKWGKSSL